MLEIIEQNNLAEQKVLVSGPDFTVEGVKPLSRCTFALGFAISRPSGRGSRDVLTQRGKSSAPNQFPGNECPFRFDQK